MVITSQDAEKLFSVFQFIVLLAFTLIYIHINLAHFVKRKRKTYFIHHPSFFSQKQPSSQGWQDFSNNSRLLWQPLAKVFWCGKQKTAGKTTKIKIDKQKNYLRDSILGKRQVLHKNIKPFIFLIEKLSHPPKWRTKHLITFLWLNTSKESFHSSKINLIHVTLRLIHWTCDSPNVIGPKRYLQLSEHLSWLLNSPSKFLSRGRDVHFWASMYLIWLESSKCLSFIINFLMMNVKYSTKLSKCFFFTSFLSLMILKMIFFTHHKSAVTLIALKETINTYPHFRKPNL